MPLTLDGRTPKRSVFDRLQFHKPLVLDLVERVNNRKDDALEGVKNMAAGHAISNFKSVTTNGENGPTQSRFGPSSKTNYCHQCLRPGHLKRNCRNKIRCLSFHMEGHLARSCKVGKKRIMLLPSIEIGAT